MFQLRVSFVLFLVATRVYLLKHEQHVTILLKTLQQFSVSLRVNVKGLIKTYKLLLPHLLLPLPHTPSLTSFLLISLGSFYSDMPGVSLRVFALVIFCLKNSSIICLHGLLVHIFQVFMWISLSHWGFPCPPHLMIFQAPIPNIHIFLSSFLLYIFFGTPV